MIHENGGEGYLSFSDEDEEFKNESSLFGVAQKKQRKAWSVSKNIFKVLWGIGRRAYNSYISAIKNLKQQILTNIRI